MESFNCSLVPEDSVTVEALPSCSTAAVSISAVASVGDGVWLSPEDTKELHAALGAVLDARTDKSELVYAEDLDAGDRFLSPSDQDVVLVVTNVRTPTYRQCVSLATGYVLHVRWSAQVRRLPIVTEVTS
jgi:hypothetical protein